MTRTFEKIDDTKFEEKIDDTKFEKIDGTKFEKIDDTKFERRLMTRKLKKTDEFTSMWHNKYLILHEQCRRKRQQQELS